MEKDTGLFEEDLNTEREKNLLSENADEYFMADFIKILPKGEFKYSIMENFMKSYCKVEIDKSRFFNYIKEGLIPAGVNKTKNSASYTSEHILLYYLINLLKDYKSIAEIKEVLNGLFKLPHFSDQCDFRVEILKNIILNYLKLKETVGKSYKEKFLNFMSLKLTGSFDNNENSSQKDEEKLLQEYSSYVVFVLMGNSISEVFKDIGFIQLENFIKNNSDSIKNIKIDERALLSCIEEMPKKMLFEKLEQKLYNSNDEERKCEEELQEIYGELRHYQSIYDKLSREFDVKNKILKELQRKRVRAFNKYL
jgi:hypothetical protein